MLGIFFVLLMEELFHVTYTLLLEANNTLYKNSNKILMIQDFYEHRTYIADGLKVFFAYNLETNTVNC